MNEPIDGYGSDLRAIVMNAIRDRELDRVLLGHEGYRHINFGTMCPGPTDVSAVCQLLFHRDLGISKRVITEQLIHAVESIVDTYEGILPSTVVITSHLIDKANGRPTLDLPIEELAAEIRASVAVHGERLWQHGNRLSLQEGFSKVSMDRGGPPLI